MFPKVSSQSFLPHPERVQKAQQLVSSFPSQACALSIPNDLTGSLFLSSLIPPLVFVPELFPTPRLIALSTTRIDQTENDVHAYLVDYDHYTIPSGVLHQYWHAIFRKHVPHMEFIFVESCSVRPYRLPRQF